MVKLLFIAFALGVASLDITAALFVIGALGAGARSRALFVFGVISILGTVVFGVSLSLLVGPRIADVDWSNFLPRDLVEFRISALVQIALGAGLIVWGAIRFFRPTVRTPKPGVPRGLGALYLAGAGIVFSLAAILDPTFISLVVIAGRDGLFWSVLAAHSIWTLVSHAPLILVLAFLLSSNGERGVVWFKNTWAKGGPYVGRVVTVVVLLAGAFLLVDGAWWYVTGRFLVPE